MSQALGAHTPRRHEAVTVCAVLPHAWFPKTAIDVVDDYVKKLGDPLVRNCAIENVTVAACERCLKSLAIRL